MSFKSLLFCPDEKTSRAVTQVLSELDFTVEPVAEAFAAVKRLTDAHFDALVVDCQNEQDASLLFKAARNSNHNSSSLSVAVVEGQTGVTKAFRIGANLVLTKPINVEQSKSTLRVARGLLRKTQPKLVSPAPARGATSAPVPLVPAAGSAVRSTAMIPAAQATAAVPFSGIELEHEPEAAPEAADAAVLESLPELLDKRPGDKPTALLVGGAEPIAVSMSGQAAAPRLAPDTGPSPFVAAGAAPMVTQEPIIKDNAAESSEADSFEAPTFAPLDSVPSQRSGGAIRLLKTAVMLTVVAGAGYFVAQRLPLSQYLQQWHSQQWLHGAATTQVSEASPAAQAPAPEYKEPSVQYPAKPAPKAADTQALSAPDSDDLWATPPQTAAQRTLPMEAIEVQELPMSRDAKAAVPSKSQPLLVKNGPTTAKPAPPTPPPVEVAAMDNASAVLPNLVAANAALPKPGPGVVRVSQGVSQGLLMKKVAPVYPGLAQKLQLEGTVQLLATVDQNGAISKVQVLSGDSMLAKAAVDAVRQWKYRPYLLNGQPIEIETQITMVFKGLK
jgi:protein TonB